MPATPKPLQLKKLPGIKLILLCLSFFAIFLFFDNTNHETNSDLTILIMEHLELTNYPTIKNSSYNPVLERAYIKKVHFYQNSLFTKLAITIFTANKAAAFTIGNTVFIGNTDQLHLQIPLVTHELAHTWQYHQDGATKFIMSYLYQMLKNGYREVSYEKDAYDFEDNVISAILKLPF